jgi:opacity protein-like surface antigen
MGTTLRLFATLAVVACSALAPVTAASAVESPPTGIPPSTFATDYKGCLGQLRSKIARGEFAGVGPFGEHFTGKVNPGAHQGTVGEEEFLRDVLGIADPAAFCAQFGR